MSEEQRALEVSPQWHVEQLRFTLFPSPDAKLDAAEWWKSVVKSDPDETNTNGRTGQTIMSSQLGSKALIALSVHVTRVDWQFGVLALSDFASDISDITLGPLPEVLTDFQKLLSSWFALDSRPSATRLAFGAVVLQGASDRSSVYELLQTYLPSLELEGVRDLLYRVNRPQKSIVVPTLTLNRLSNWSAQIFVQQQFTASATHAIGRRELNFARLELDYSTDADFGSDIERNSIEPLFVELSDLAVKTSEQGDKI